MQQSFSKYHGAGNDFIIIDNRNKQFNPAPEVINSLCHRHFGIGADGLMLLENSEHADFFMRYFNSDGHEATMCGNGGRCLVMFASKLGIIKDSTHFMGVDGEHKAQILDKENVRLKMIDVNEIQIEDDHYIINTGSPHYIQFVNDIEKIDVENQGRVIRSSFSSHTGGVNVNFAQFSSNGIKIRTYERGVEAETLACGTGAVATAIAANHWFNEDESLYALHARGGELKVSFERTASEQYQNIWLQGPTVHVFDGVIKLVGGRWSVVGGR
ncbi:MAG: diaminopimelate epimerase [Bacteroidales bacterium]